MKPGRKKVWIAAIAFLLIALFALLGKRLLQGSHSAPQIDRERILSSGDDGISIQYGDHDYVFLSDESHFVKSRFIVPLKIHLRYC